MHLKLGPMRAPRAVATLSSLTAADSAVEQRASIVVARTHLTKSRDVGICVNQRQPAHRTARCSVHGAEDSSSGVPQIIRHPSGDSSLGTTALQRHPPARCPR
eukprot:scaffold50221_cov66-Phaeocystis_antarctica.AAC.2